MPMYIDQEFYERIAELAEIQSSSEPALEQYLRSLLNVLKPHAARSKLEQTEFFDILAAAFMHPPQDFDQEWSKIDESDCPLAGYEDVVAVLKRQVAQLRSFRPEQVETAQIYLETGECWNNFSVGMYLECAARGGWDNSRGTARLNRLLQVDWNDIRLFLWQGQSYE